MCLCAQDYSFLLRRLDRLGRVLGEGEQGGSTLVWELCMLGRDVGVLGAGEFADEGLRRGLFFCFRR